MSKVFAKDQGQDFGRWTDPTSRLMYRDVMPVMLNGLDLSSPVIDLGGANGLLQEFFPGPVFTVDIDPTKDPDVVADARTWAPPAGARTRLVVMRYLLHYLPDADVRAMLAHVHGWHRGPVLVIQFANEPADMEAKRASSLNEEVWFRTPAELEALVVGPWRIRDRKRVDFTVRAEFYANRLGNPNGREHGEAVLGLVLEP